jgi:putative ABC transport system substrate-binding protein
LLFPLSFLSAVLLTFTDPVPAQQTRQVVKKLSRVGVLSPGSLPLGSLDSFRQALRDNGYVEGQNISFEWRFAEGRNERLPELAKELIGLNVDVMFVINTQAAQAAKSATATIPIVFARVSDSPRTGLVASLARPGGNITGLSNIADELGGKRLELLKETLPHVSRVAVLWNSGNSGVALILKEMELASPQLGVQIESVPVRGGKDFRSTFETVRKGQVGAVFVLDDLLISSYKREILAVGPAKPAARNFIVSGIRRERGPHGLWTEHPRHVPAGRILCGQNPQRHQTERSPR